MTEPTQPRKTEILRYADGELDGERAEAVRAHLAGDPVLAREVQSLRQLRAASKQSFLARTAELSDEMRASLESIIAGNTSPTAAAPLPQGAWFLAPRWRLAAGILIVGGLLGASAWWLNGSGGSNSNSAELLRPIDSIEPAGPHRAIVVAVTRKHDICTQMKNHFYDQRFPKVLAELPPAVREHFGEGAPMPDLTSLGYDFAGAGGCMLPGGNTLHLLYRSSKGSARYVSVFAQRYTGQIELPPKGVLLLAGPDAAHPLLCWRDDTTLCFLVADEAESFTGARALLGVPTP